MNIVFHEDIERAAEIVMQIASNNYPTHLQDRHPDFSAEELYQIYLESCKYSLALLIDILGGKGRL